jgi:hypothetical protein
MPTNSRKALLPLKGLYMNGKVALLAIVLVTGAVHSLDAQTFKAGDYVDARLFDQWLPCKVFKPETNWLVPGSAGLRGYTVTCTVNKTSGPQESSVGLADVRARAATAEDKRLEAETAAALARQPRGDSVGAKYGTREPRACGDRTAPAHGAPSAEQAKHYVICELEQGDGQRPLLLVTNVRVQVAPVSHPPNELIKEITAARIDPREPVWDIRGSFTSYKCDALSSLTAQNDFAHTHNCWVSEQPNATGYCYKDTFGDWHCGMLGGAANNWRTNVLPPEGY